MDSIFFLDIETIPSQSDIVMAHLRAELQAEKDSISAPGNYKDTAKITEYIASKCAELDSAFEAKYRSTALDGARGQICCIGVSVNDSPAVAFYKEDWQQPDAEREILMSFFDYMSTEVAKAKPYLKPCFVGHNIINFDLRFIFQRAVVQGVKPPLCIPFTARPWDTDSVCDTMTAWAGVGNRVKLEKICVALGIPLKGSELDEPIDGSKVWDFVKAGKIGDVATYCLGDVNRVRSIYRRLTFTG